LRRGRQIARSNKSSPVGQLIPSHLPKLLHQHVQEGYERELEDNESIWRSLPLFAVLISLAGASLNFLAAAAPTPERGAWAWIVYGLIVGDVALYGWGARHLMITVLPRRHRYIANDSTVRGFGLDLLNFHRGAGLDESSADAAAAADLERYLTEELAAASSEIQVLNHKKAYARAQALFWLSLGFIFWFFASTAIIVEQRLFEARSSNHGPRQGSSSGAPARADRRFAPASPHPTAAAVHRGGGGSPVPTPPLEKPKPAMGQ
jgi:hypothetical protein